MRLLSTIKKTILLLSLVLSSTFTFSQAGGTTCPNMEPICTDAGVNFQANSGGPDVTSSEPGNNYGCLGTSPNPSWFYLEISTPGDLIMSLTAASDIDFIIWGPYPDLATAQATCGNHQNVVPDINCGLFGCDAEGCSWSTSASETPGIPNAQVGEVYVMLVTNYANNVQDISLTQTGGSAGTNCNIVFPTCAIDNFTANIGACNSATNTYDISGSVDFSSAPSTGNLFVRDCSGTVTTIGSAPFPTSAALNYNINGLNADGSPCSLDVWFEDDPGCSEVINFTAPAPCNATCAISSVTSNVGNCTAGNTYTVSGDVTYSNAPTSGTLTVTNSCGGSQSFNYPFPASPVSYSIGGLTADGASCTVTASFSGPACSQTGNYTAPNVPNANAGPPQDLSCTVTSVALSGSSSTGGATYSWAGPGVVSGGASATPTVNAPGSYTVTVTDPANSCTSTSNVNVTQDITTPDANAGTPQTLDCTNTTAILNGSSSTGGATYSWAGPGIVSGGASATPTVNQPGTYTLTVTNPTNGCTATSTVDITQTAAAPNANAGTPQVLNCTHTSAVLNGTSSTAGTTFSWTGPGVVSGGTTLTPTVDQPGTYELTVTDPSNSCTSTSSVNVSQNITTPDVNAGADQIISCSSSSVNLNGSSSTAGVNFSWAGPGIVSGGNTAAPSVDQAGAYTLTVTDPSNGCTSSASVNVTNDVGIPNANAGASQILNCTVNSVILGGSSSTSGVTFSWSGPGIVSGGSSATPTVNQPGAYTLTVNDPSNGCSANATVNITQNITPPNADAGTTQILNCTTTNTILNGSSSTAGATFSWAGPGIVSGGSLSNPTVDQPGTYTLTVTDPANTCTSTSTVDVTQDITPPNANAGATQELNCTTTSVMLNGSSSTAGTTFSWSGTGIVSGGGTATPTVNQSGTYTLTVTNPANGCTATSTVSVTENITPPDANAGNGQVLSCSATSIVLNGSSLTAGVDFLWAGPGIVSGGATATPTANQAGTYTLTVTDPANGCTSSSTVAVTEDVNTPNASAGQTQILNCTVTTVTLNGSSSTAGTTYSWSGPGIVSGGTTTTPTIDQPGTYTITVTDPANGCTSTSTVEVTQNIIPPNADAGTTQVLNCTTSSFVQNGSSSTAGVIFSWNGPGIVSGGNSATPTINEPGAYTLTVTDPSNGCTSTSNVNITQDITVPAAAFSADSLIGCGTVPVNFQETSGQIGMNYEWDFGNGNTSNSGSATSEVFNQVGCYNISLTVNNPINGCSNTVMYPSLICVVAQPDASFEANPTAFESIDGLVDLNNSSTNSTDYEWTFGDGSPSSNIVNPSHDYSGQTGSFTIQLVASNQGICFDTAWRQINIRESLIFYVPNAFTPDGDSYNEYFKPVFYSGFDPYNFTMLIFNRWGEIIWESHDYDVGWNGTYGGSIVPDGVYTWKIEVKTNATDERKVYTGHVNVIR